MFISISYLNTWDTWMRYWSAAFLKILTFSLKISQCCSKKEEFNFLMNRRRWYGRSDMNDQLLKNHLNTWLQRVPSFLRVRNRRQLSLVWSANLTCWKVFTENMSTWIEAPKQSSSNDFTVDRRFKKKKTSSIVSFSLKIRNLLFFLVHVTSN